MKCAIVQLERKGRQIEALLRACVERRLSTDILASIESSEAEEEDGKMEVGDNDGEEASDDEAAEGDVVISFLSRPAA